MIIQLTKSIPSAKRLSKRKRKTVRYTKRQQAYRIYLQSNWWKFKRLEKIQKTGGKCEVCGSNKKLIVHHLCYRHKGKSILYREKDLDLAVLCKYCHNRLHKRYGRGASFGRKEIQQEHNRYNTIL